MNPAIDQYMATDLVCVKASDNIVHAMRLLLERHFSGAPVLDDAGELVGMLSQKDCMAIIYKTAYHQDWGGQVGQYMNPEVECLDAGCSLLDAADRFLNSTYRRFPVLRDGELVGQISRHDIMRALDENYLRAAP